MENNRLVLILQVDQYIQYICMQVLNSWYMYAVLCSVIWEGHFDR